MLRTTLLAALAFAGTQAVDIRSAAQIEMGSFAINDPSGVEGMLAQTSYVHAPQSCLKDPE